MSSQRFKSAAGARPLPAVKPPVRVIARLDVKGANVIKGVHLEGLRKMGPPNEHALRYYDQGIDELLFMDAVASLYDRNNILPILSKAATNVFVPMTVGGGIRTIDDIRAALRAGADKVAINTAAVKDPEFLARAARVFGSQCIVLSVEAKAVGGGHWEVMTDCGRERTGRDVLEWIVQAEALGAGEILLTSIDTEGTRNGFDLVLVRNAMQAVSVPVIASGGAGTIDHAVTLFSETKVEAAAFASVLHYNQYTVDELKKGLAEAAIPVRPA